MSNKSGIANSIYFFTWFAVLFIVLSSELSVDTKWVVGLLMVAQLVAHSQILVWIGGKETAERIRAEGKEAMKGFKRQ